MKALKLSVSLGLSNGTCLPAPPSGYTYLQSSDGAYLQDSTGAYLLAKI